MINFEVLIDYLKNNKLNLLGEIPISEEDDELLKESAKNMITRLKEERNVFLNEKGKLILSLALVQIARNEYNERKFWDNFKETLGIQKLQTNDQSRIGQIFLETIRKYQLFEIKNDTDRNIYVQNILAHSFVANEYLDGYFEFLYSFYEDYLDYEIINDTIDSDIDNLIKYVCQFSGIDDTFIESNGSSSVKSYKLLKSTRDVISQGKRSLVLQILKKHLYYLDSVYYSKKVKYSTKDDFFIQQLRLWSNKKAEEFKNSRKKYSINMEIFRNKAPLLCLKNGRPYIFIPPQKLSNEYNSCKVEIYINDELMKDFYLEVYNASFGIRKTELVSVELEESWIFDKIKIVINDKKEVIYHEKNYRLFNFYKNDNFDYYITEKLDKDECCVLIAKNSTTTIKGDPSYSNAIWKEYDIQVNSDTKFLVDNTLISANNELDSSGIEIYYTKPSNFTITKKDDTDTSICNFVSTFKHPIIYLRQDKDFLSGNPIIECNGLRKKLKEEKITTYSDKEDKIDISFDISDIFSFSDDGIYNIKISNKGKDILNEKYLLLNEINFSLDNDIYFDKKEAIINYNYSDVYYIRSLDNNCKKKQGKQGQYEYTLSNNDNIAKFEILIAEEEYIINLPINVFKYKFLSRSNWKCIFDKEKNYIWYEDINSPYFYALLPNVSYVELFFGNNPHFPIIGELDKKENVFVFNISELHDKIKTDVVYNDTLNIRYTLNAKTKEKIIGKIVNQPIIPKFEFGYDDEKEMGYIDTEFEYCPDKYECAATLIDTNNKHATNPIHVKFENGRTYIPNINSQNKNSHFNIFKKLVETITHSAPASKNIFSKTQFVNSTIEKPFGEKICNISPLKNIKISSESRFKIEKIIYKNTEYELYHYHQIYVKDTVYNEKDLYYGGLYISNAFRKTIDSFKITICPINGKSNCVYISSNGNNLWYNCKQKVLSNIEPSEHNRDNFLRLNDGYTEFVVSIKNTRRNDYAIQTSREFQKY